MRALDDIPAVEVADGTAQGIENTRDVKALGILEQRVQTRNLDAEVACEQFKQGGIHARLIIALADAEAFAYEPTLQGQRHQQDGRQPRLLAER